LPRKAIDPRYVVALEAEHRRRQRERLEAERKRADVERGERALKNANPLLRADGSPIGLGAYCRIVTPQWNWNWPHLRALDVALDKVIGGEIRRLIVVMPTRIGKTEKVSVRFPSYALELHPDWPMMVTAYNDKYASRLSRKIRRVAAGRVPFAADRNAAGDWETEQGGGVRAAGVGVGIAGLPAKLILVDDPTKSRDDAYSQAHRDKVWEWFIEDLYTRLEPDGAMVVTMARRHEDDLVGRILASEDAANWTVVHLPALAEDDDPLGRRPGEALCPDRFDEKAYAKMRKLQGEVAFSALQQGRPAPASGLVFKSAWWRYYTTHEHPIKDVPTLPPVFASQLQSWDMSFKDKKSSDKVSGMVIARLGANAYLRDRSNDRRDFVGTIKAVQDMTKKWPAATLKLVEDKANGPAVISQLRTSIPGLVAVEPKGDKVSRAHAVTPLFESGNVWFPHPSIAPWVKALELELLQFPFGANDDDVDALVQGLLRIIAQINGEPDPQAENEKPQLSETVQWANQRY
jgi:predicted phage terminase large subunit-like protein